MVTALLEDIVVTINAVLMY